MQSIKGIFKSLTSAPKEQPKVQKDRYVNEKMEINQPLPDKGDNSCDDTYSDGDLQLLKETVYDLIKDIKDPEKPQTLEELDVVSEDNITVERFHGDKLLVSITFVPTVPHCSLASLIGLCLRQKVTQCLPDKHKLDIFVKEGSHETSEDINKQINDKERIAAAMENPNLLDLVNKCVDDEG